MSQAFELASSAEEVTLVPVLHGLDQPGAAIFIERLQAMRMSSMICPVSGLVHLPGCPVSDITWKISTWDPGITILASQLTGLARLSYNRRVDFCCVYN